MTTTKQVGPSTSATSRWSLEITQELPNDFAANVHDPVAPFKRNPHGLVTVGELLPGIFTLLERRVTA